MSQLENLLQQCTVKLSLPGQMGWGTGFFVAPEWILTCAHVVKGAKGEPVKVWWQKQENWSEAVVEDLLPDPYDLALLRVKLPPDTNPPCVYLDGAIQSRDPLYLFGYPDQDFPNGCPVTLNCEGLTGDEPGLIKFALGQVRPGMSGAPLLNQRTGKVCGIVKFTRDRSFDLGGGAVPTTAILEQFPQLREFQEQFHQRDRRWRDLEPKLINSPGTVYVEGFTSITPIENEDVEAQERETLSNEFYRGISARYKHILAAVDKPRPNKLNEINQKFKENQLVIVHGASGQGKTTLAYRYLHDFFRDHQRFQVQVVEGRKDALNIANALARQAKESEIPIAVYLDVAPNDVGWDELVKQLSSHRNIQTLVTIREEDFRRTSISGAELQFSAVELRFDRPEAAEIYQFLVDTEKPTQFLDFDDAWNRFGGEGPLMEFVYLVTQGNSLREKLRQQVRQIQDEVRSGKRSEAELKLLRLVSVASAFEARLKVRELVLSLKLPEPQRTLEVMEKEYYLLKTIKKGAWVGGLHPIRSGILADILTDPTFYPWSETATECLPFIVDQDVSNFLLYAFSRYRTELEPLLNALDSYQPRQWVAIAGVVRALIWLGIKEYVETNQQLITDTQAVVSSGWQMVLNGDIAGASPNVIVNLHSTLARFLPEDRLAQLQAFRRRQTQSSQVFVRASQWLSNLTQEPIPPQLELDWVGMAEALFWIGRLEVNLPIINWLSRVDLDSAVETLTLETLADVALGLFYCHEAGYQSWINDNYARLISRFQRETQTVVLEDDGQNLRLHFLIELFQTETFSSEIPQLNSRQNIQSHVPIEPSQPGIQRSESQPSQTDLERYFLNAAMERLELCRKFFPDRERYGSQGYGHRIWINTELPDDTHKNIPLSNFPIQWLVSLNAIFRGLVEQTLRPNTWEEYTQLVLELRRTIVQVLQQLKQGLDVYFRQKQMTRILGVHIESSLWTRSQQLVQCSPLLPSCAFDEWGFVSDSSDRSSERSKESNQKDPYQRQNLALEKYNSYRKAFNKYICAYSNFFGQSENVLNFNPYFRHGENTRVQEIAQQANINLNQQARLSVLNLGDARKVLPKFQAEFRNLLSQFVEVDELSNLEHSEQAIFNDVWCSWYFFAFHPNQRFQNATWQCTQQFSNQVGEIRNNIKRELRRLCQTGLQVSILSEDVLWEEDRTLWLVINGENVFDVYNTVEGVVSAIRRAIAAAQNQELRHYAITFTWSNIVIVPLLKGKSLDGTAWRFSSILFSVDRGEDTFGQWNFVPVAIPSNAFSQLALTTWTYPRLLVGQKLIGLLLQLSLLVSHIREFEQLPELDEQGHELLQQYIQRLTTPMGEIFQAVLDTETEIIDYFNQLLPSEQANRPHLITVVQGLAELHEQILPTADCSRDGRIQLTMNLSEVAEWASRLESIQQSVSLIYFFWVSDVLEEGVMLGKLP